MIKTTLFDAAEFLDNDEAIAAFIEDTLVDSEAAFIAQGIGIAARAYGMTHFAKLAGVSRAVLFESLSEDGTPERAMLLRIANALGLNADKSKLGKSRKSADTSKRQPAKKGEPPVRRRSAKPRVEA